MDHVSPELDADCRATPVGRLLAERNEAGEHFIRSHHGTPEIREHEYALEVTGLVQRPVRWALADHKTRTVKGHPAYAGPRDHPPCPDTFFVNDGDGRFTDSSAASGIAAVAGPGMGVVCLDADDDGDQDVYVGNDALHGNFLFQNDGRGRFAEVGLAAGVAVNRFGSEIGSLVTEAAEPSPESIVTSSPSWAK